MTQPQHTNKVAPGRTAAAVMGTRERITKLGLALGLTALVGATLVTGCGNGRGYNYDGLRGAYTTEVEGIPMEEDPVLVAQNEKLAEDERVALIREDCRSGGAKSCEVMALDAFNDYSTSGNLTELKSGIIVASRACASEARACLLKGNMIFRAYQDGMDIDEWRPGRYYSEELLDAYTKATRVGDPKLRAEAYYQRAMVHSTFGRYSAARSDFNQSCTIGGQEFCLKSGDELAAIAKHTTKQSGKAKITTQDVLSLYEQSCDGANATACLRLGDRLYAQGKSKAGNEAYAKACNLNEGSACNALAYRLDRAGRHTDARQFYDKSCSLKYPASCALLGREDLVKGNLSSSYNYLEQACSLGDNTSCQFLGSLAQVIGRNDNARTALRSACSLSNGVACYDLGLLEALANSHSSAIEHLGMACDSGINAACLAQSGGFASAQSSATAAYEKACSLRSPDACLNLGYSKLQQGKAGEAQNAFRRACELKSAAGCEQAAALLQESGGSTEAAKFYTQACALKSPSACTKLGLVYYSGAGVTKSATSARANLNQACKLGAQDACVMLKKK